jgi:hypothetical protein
VCKGVSDDVGPVQPHFFIVGVEGESCGVRGTEGADRDVAGQGEDWWGVSWAVEERAGSHGL